MSDRTETETGSTTATTGLSGGSLLERWDRVREREWFLIAAAIAFVLVFPTVFLNLPVYSGYMSLVKLIYIWAIFAIGFDLLLGYTGLLSFGHAIFWGTSAYAAGIFSARFFGEPLLMILVGGVTAVLFAVVIGILSLRRSGIYFAILTLAFGQMLYFVALGPADPLTSGVDGFTSVDIEPLLGAIPLHSISYAFFATFFVLAVAVAVRIVRSPYGVLLRAIRENEQRVSFLGLHVRRYKLAIFVISAAFAGVAGSLHTLEAQYVAVSSLFWITSGDIVIITVLGGAGSIFGPVLGTIAFLYVENVISGVVSYWLLILGVLFVVVVWFFPGGIWGLISRGRQRLRNRLSTEEEP